MPIVRCAYFINCWHWRGAIVRYRSLHQMRDSSIDIIYIVNLLAHWLISRSHRLEYSVVELLYWWQCLDYGTKTHRDLTLSMLFCIHYLAYQVSISVLQPIYSRRQFGVRSFFLFSFSIGVGIFTSKRNCVQKKTSFQTRDMNFPFDANALAFFSFCVRVYIGTVAEAKLYVAIPIHIFFPGALHIVVVQCVSYGGLFYGKNTQNMER